MFDEQKLHLKQNNSTVVFALIIVISAVVFGTDAFTSHGTGEWIFYLFPVMLCIWQPKPALAYYIGLLEAVLAISGFFLSPLGISYGTAAINRVFVVVAIFGVAYLVHRALVEKLQARNLLWTEKGLAEVSQSMLGEQTVNGLAQNALSTLTKYIGARVGVLYQREKSTLVPISAYAFALADGQIAHVTIGQGVVGETVRQKKITVLQDVPDNYLQIKSGLGSSKPSHIFIAPLTAERKTLGAIEIAFLHAPESVDNVCRLLEMAGERIGIGIRTALHRKHLEELLEQTQRQSTALQAQQEELRVTNEELQEQSRALLESQSTLETQQNELEQANLQLKERTDMLESQKSQLLRTQKQLESNAAELERASRYKSEFLANMSHELRTPLNSSLILSQLLTENRNGNLSEEQIRYARTIHGANTDLLTLINDILDLSKIEAGQVTLQIEPVSIRSMLDTLQQTFAPIAQKKGVQFKLSIAPGTPSDLITDEQRLQQIIKNLLSNAFKFTEKGEVALDVAATSDKRIRISVRDTGIGIAEKQQEVIFEAFRQADGSTSRTYGGTGLGLSISRQLARLLHGEIQLSSTPGTGSTFTLEVPQRLKADAAPPPSKPVGISAPQPVQNEKPADRSYQDAAMTPVLPDIELNGLSDEASAVDDRAHRTHERAILVVEDDEKFASILGDLVREMKFDYIHALNGAAAVKLARELQPHAILLDVRLPDYSGLSVLEQLKRDASTRHIPVHMLSGDDYSQAALRLGAIGYTLKPVAREEIIGAIQKLENTLTQNVNRLLIVEDNADLRESLTQMLGSANTHIISVGTASEALQQLSSSTFDCMVMDLMLPDASGYDLLEQMASGGKYAFPPVIVYTGRELSRDEEQRLRRYSQSIIIKGARSPERLLDEVSLFLHKVEASLPPEQQQTLMQVRQRDAAFEGAQILIAEDDVRNVFALTSIFEPMGARLEITRNGKEALERLGKRQDIDLVLMDLMMPEMDGLTAIREIRKQPQYKDLPIIALTAKAMSNDRSECLEAGANDYIAKPINIDQLVSLCRVWMPK